MAQTFRDFEVLAINDGSTDGTRTILDAYRDRRVRVIHLERNVGLAAVRNIGIEEAKGQYVAWLDSDDVSLPHRLVKQVRVLAGDRRVGICGSWVKTIGDEPGHVWNVVGQRMWAVCRYAGAAGHALARFSTSPLARVVLRHPLLALGRVAELGLKSAALTV